MRPLLILPLFALALAACQPSAESPADAPAAAASVDTAAAAPASSGAAADGDDHAHGSPHGGTVKTAGAGHLELVTEHTGFKIYVLDAAEKPLPLAGIAGAEALVQPEGGEAVTVPLALMNDHLHATLPEGTLAYTAIVSVPVAGETRTAQFSVGLDSHTTHAH